MGRKGRGGEERGEGMDARGAGPPKVFGLEPPLNQRRLRGPRSDACPDSNYKQHPGPKIGKIIM
jgi:hypothetical protein